MKSEQMMQNYLAECALHAKVLDEGLSDIRQWSPITTDVVIDKEHLRILDQIAYRFTKLQDSMGEKLLPLILVLAQEPIPENVTFAEKLNRLERIGAIPSAEGWKGFRVVRNALAHDYPDDPELRTSAINRFIKGATDLSTLFQQVNDYIVQHFPLID
ncbi:MAG: hypothetical protein WCL60_01745 [Methylococcales bacterium]